MKLLQRWVISWVVITIVTMPLYYLLAWPSLATAAFVLAVLILSPGDDLDAGRRRME